MGHPFTKVQSTGGLERWEHQGIEVTVARNGTNEWQTDVRLSGGRAYMYLYKGPSRETALDRARAFMSLNDASVWGVLNGDTGGFGL